MHTGKALAVAAAVVVTAATGLAMATATGNPGPATESFAGIIALDYCSAALVTFRGADADRPALMLTNGHCKKGDLPGAGQVITDEAATRTGTLLTGDGGNAGTVTTDRLLYATMTDTDVALYRLTTTYRAIADRYGIAPVTIAAHGPQAGDALTVSSGYWRRRYHCPMDGQVHQIKEAQWTWRDSIRYVTGCETPHGTSGSPLLDDRTGEVVGINNTGNDSGGRCTLNNPCEVDPAGQVSVLPRRAYGQQTWWFTTCLNHRAQLDLTVPGCRLPRGRTGALNGAGQR